MWNWNQLNQQKPACTILGLDLCQDQKIPMSSKAHHDRVAEHNLQVVTQEFKKIHEPKISKLKGGYSVIAALIFIS